MAMATNRVLLGIDLGQTACKAVALDPASGVVAAAAHGYPTSQPQPGWVEQDPRDWLTAVASACREVVATAAGAEIVAVTLTGATHNAVLIAASGAPVRPCITLRDTRATAQAQRIAGELGAELLVRARNPAGADWTAPQLAWIRECEPEAWRRACGLLFAKDYVRYWLTGERGTDYIDAEGSLLLNAGTRRWDQRLCAVVPIDPDWLPPLLAPAQPAGHVCADAAARTGLPPGTPVMAGCSDTAAEALACGAVAPAQGVVKLATAGNVNVVSARPRPAADHYCYSHPVAGLVYHSYGTNAAAASRDWFQRLLGAPEPADYEQLDREVAGVAAGAGGVMFHPYLFGERAPVFDGELRASFLGLRGGHGRAHMLRAVLEGVALSLAECAEAARAAGFALEELRIIGGGARSGPWRGIVADALGRPLLVPVLGDASAGAALLAGVGAGIFPDPAGAAGACSGVSEVIEPDPGRAAVYTELLAMYRQARADISPVTRRLAELTGT